jgi:hypothetical protein
MFTWLPIFPINEDKMNELVPAKRVADWRRLKALVLDSVSSPITRRVYNLGLDEFFEWFGREPRSGFNRATVSTLIEIDPSPRASSATRQALTVAFVKPGRGSLPNHSKNSSNPRL